jgi:O-6-methylguanine DNA methyltransferase
MVFLTTLQARWTELYSNTLPSLARARDPAQPKWSVTLDHCFARIILDNTVGEGQDQWDKRLKKPAVKNMSDEQLLAAIELGEKIRKGDVDLVALDMQSLEARGKGEKKCNKPPVPEEPEQTQSKTAGDAAGHKRKHIDDDDDDDDDAPAPSTITKQQKSKKHQSTLPFNSLHRSAPLSSPPSSEPILLPPDLKPILHKISTNSTLTPYRKRLYSTLCSVPRGRYTTYAAMSSFLDSSARAVGNGMRNNPFAPDVPCHRVLAADGSIGGFRGSWGKDGEHATKKVKLLRDEGVRFDGKGKVVGEPFRKFVDLSMANPP